MLRYLKTDEIHIKLLPFQVSEPSICYDSRTVSFHFHSGGPDSVTHSSKPISGLWFGTFILKDLEFGLLVNMSANMRMMQRVAGNKLYFTENR